ncbi:Conserved oligomeric Golgi complex subunit 2 [Taenia crassiceps]|uniref:Conserved oligomeric Golgi complex subunit 2 n=1 Tax=Taenia crassiceps TaxID=6207 RepID=A0ABR4QND7_9CEST
MPFGRVGIFRHADPQKVCEVWKILESNRGQKQSVPVDKLVRPLRKVLDMQDDSIRLLLTEIEGDGLIVKVSSCSGKGCDGYRLPDFHHQCPRQQHDWYCFRCHKPGEMLHCSDCFRAYHSECVNDDQHPTPHSRNVLSPGPLDDDAGDFTCPVCESRPKCEFSRKQIRKLLEFATHNLRKQPSWKHFNRIGYPGDIEKNEYIVYKYVDMDLLQRKIKDGRYTALEFFAMDVELLVHDVCLLFGPFSNDADEARFLLRSVNNEITEIQLCTDCYINAKARVGDWITKPCKPPHEFICACNRSASGAGLFENASIRHCYWPAKILLERDDGYEIRFFGGTHERAFVKKTHTAPFVLPEIDPAFHRRALAGAHNVPTSLIERAWNEVRKLQANLNSGYYSHSSGESDMPPSDDDYTDEIYIRPRRHAAVSLSNSPRSSATANSAKLKSTIKRARRNVASSEGSSRVSSRSSISSPSQHSSGHSSSDTHRRSSNHRSGDNCRLKGGKTPASKAVNTNSKLTASAKQRFNTETTSPVAAAALSALAETKAAVAAAFNKKRGSGFGDPVTGAPVNPQRRGRGRPPGSGMKKRKRKTSSASLSSLSRSVSDGENYKMRSSLSTASKKKNRSASTTTSSESGSNDEKLTGSSWSPRGKKYGQRGSGSKKRTNGHLTSKTALKDSPQSSYMSNNNSLPRHTSLSTIARRPRGRPPFSSVRGGSSRKIPSSSRKKAKSNPHSESDSELTDRCSTTFPSRRPQATPLGQIQMKRHKTSSSASPTSTSESGNSSDASGDRRHLLLRRPPFAPPISTPSSVAVIGTTQTAVAASLGGSGAGIGSMSSSSSLSQQQLCKSGFTALEMAGRSSGLGSVPRSHLPPNKRLAAAAVAAGSDIKIDSPPHSSTASSLHPGGVSPRKLSNKQVQTIGDEEGQEHQQRGCARCKENVEAARRQAMAEQQQALGELEARLSAEHSAALAAAVERERALARETLDAAEARFNDALEKLANDALESTLGIAPSGLEFCFDRRGFLNDNFDEDAFILDRLKMGISLQDLHDSLLQYFNILKNSLVELINRDCADFVNLSTNLVGLDKIIKSLEDPLMAMRERVSYVLSEIQETKNTFELSLEERKKLRDKKELVNSLITVATCTSRLERWLSPTIQSSEDFHPLATDDSSSVDKTFREEQQIDRVAQEYTKLQHFVKKCASHPFVEDLKPRIHSITTSLQNQLEGRLRCGLDLCHEAQFSCQLHSTASKRASSVLRQTLSTYLSIDKLANAIALYRQHCLHSQLSKIFLLCPELSVSGADLDAAALTLRKMFAEAIALLDNELSLFQTLVFKQLHRSYEPLSEFDVIADAFLPETVDILFNQLPDIFSAGNPDKFHKLYKIGLEFLDLVEARADSTKQVMKVRENPVYASFLNKWSLNVYFQLRYQECTEIISDCSKDVFKEAEIGPPGYALAVTATVMRQMKRCWSEDVYLDALRHRFWKLTLQLINAYGYLIGEKALNQSINSSDKVGISSVEPLLLVLFDGSLFLKWINEGNLANLVLPKINLQQADPLPDWMTQCIEDSSERINTALTSTESKICRVFEEKMQSSTKQIQDLPRQYRRTNRDWPSTPSAFMSRIVEHLTDLAQVLQSGVLSKPQVEASPVLHSKFVELFERIVLQTTNMYHTQTSELMVSVRKVEDSLRRLRVARAVGGAQQAGVANKTDDDKIRHQVHVNTLEYASQLKSLPLLSEEGLQLNLDVLATAESSEKASTNMP